MRFTLTLLAWIVMVGGLSLYMSGRETATAIERAPVSATTAVGSYDVELTTTFSVEQDPFALQLDDSGSDALTVRLNGTALALTSGTLSRGQVLRIEAIPGVVDGSNELYVEASPPVEEAGLDQGIRVRVLHDKQILVDQTLWGEQGALVSGSVAFSSVFEEEDDHDH